MSTNNKWWRGCGEKEALHCWWECKLTQPLWKTWRFLKKLRITPPYDPAIPLLGIYPEETKTEKDTCTPMVTVTLFIIAKTWKQPRCPWIDARTPMLTATLFTIAKTQKQPRHPWIAEWIKKLWYIYTMEYYSVIKRNAFGQF